MIHIIWNERQAMQAWEQGRDDYSHYLCEILQQIGVDIGDGRLSYGWSSSRTG